ncbi:hypothetical protein NESM_000127500 [Novymonas esmeraldas]|uniref:Uncharacterized protein n=1 Tax=Novymonas esmeraldas TaxID=1808958 RepID=A0AAW0F2B0_9TRYP
MSASSSRAAPPQLPAMPAALRELTTLVEGLSAEAVPQHTDATAAPPPPVEGVVATADLLRLVERLQDNYQHLLELAQRHCSGADGRPEAADHCMTAIESTVAELQRGIRSKHAQATRLTLLHTLRHDVAEKRRCVSKLEGVLSASHQHVRL